MGNCGRVKVVGKSISQKRVGEPQAEHTTWVHVSQQHSDNECVYYTIMNGWAVALGLIPDPNANIEWTHQFHNELQDVIHLACIRQTYWSLIYNFLRCHGFILDEEVPDDRYFSHTTALLNEPDS